MYKYNTIYYIVPIFIKHKNDANDLHKKNVNPNRVRISIEWHLLCRCERDGQVSLSRCCISGVYAVGAHGARDLGAASALEAGPGPSAILPRPRRADRRVTKIDAFPSYPYIPEGDTTDPHPFYIISISKIVLHSQRN